MLSQIARDLAIVHAGMTQEAPAIFRYLTKREAAASIRCSLRFFDSLDLPFIRKGRCNLYDRIDLDARMQQDKCRGRAWKEILWPVNVDSTARKDSRFWWINLVLADGRRVCQSTGRVDRTAAEAFAVRLKGEALEARQQGRLGKSKDGVSNATDNRALEVVRRILNVAHQDWRWLRAVPRIRMLKEPRRRVRFLRREEADRLIDALPGHMKPIVRFALATGCRAVRSTGSKWSRVDLVRKVAWLDHGTTKSGEGRGIPLNADAMAALESTLGQHPRWCFTYAGRRIRQSSTAWDKAKRRAGIEDFRFHD